MSDYLNKERDASNKHYCALCNAWIANNKFNIALHENSARHQHNLQLKMSRMKRQEDDEEKVKRDLEIMKRVWCDLFGLGLFSFNPFVFTESPPASECSSSTN